MKLWLDDVRPPPDETWLWCRSVFEAKMLVKLWKNRDEFSLDYSMGSPECPGGCYGDEGLKCGTTCWCPCHKNLPNGVEFLEWMDANDIWPKKLALHTDNPLGRDKMLKVLKGFRRVPADMEVVHDGPKE